MSGLCHERRLSGGSESAQELWCLSCRDEAESSSSDAPVIVDQARRTWKSDLARFSRLPSGTEIPTMRRLGVIPALVAALFVSFSSCGAPKSPEELERQGSIHAQFTVRRDYSEVRQRFEAFIRSCVANRSANYQPLPLKFINLEEQRTTIIWLVADAFIHQPAQLILIKSVGDNLTEVTSKTEYPPSILERDLLDVSNSPTIRRC